MSEVVLFAPKDQTQAPRASVVPRSTRQDARRPHVGFVDPSDDDLHTAIGNEESEDEGRPRLVGFVDPSDHELYTAIGCRGSEGTTSRGLLKGPVRSAAFKEMREPVAQGEPELFSFGPIEDGQVAQMNCDDSTKDAKPSEPFSFGPVEGLSSDQPVAQIDCTCNEDGNSGSLRLAELRPPKLALNGLSMPHLSRNQLVPPTSGLASSKDSPTSRSWQLPASTLSSPSSAKPQPQASRKEPVADPHPHLKQVLQPSLPPSPLPPSPTRSATEPAVDPSLRLALQPSLPLSPLPLSPTRAASGHAEGEAEIQSPVLSPALRRRRQPHQKEGDSLSTVVTNMFGLKRVALQTDIISASQAQDIPRSPRNSSHSHADPPPAFTAALHKVVNQHSQPSAQTHVASPAKDEGAAGPAHSESQQQQLAAALPAAPRESAGSDPLLVSGPFMRPPLPARVVTVAAEDLPADPQDQAASSSSRVAANAKLARTAGPSSPSCASTGAPASEDCLEPPSPELDHKAKHGMKRTPQDVGLRHQLGAQMQLGCNNIQIHIPTSPPRGSTCSDPLEVTFSQQLQPFRREEGANAERLRISPGHHFPASLLGTPDGSELDFTFSNQLRPYRREAGSTGDLPRRSTSSIEEPADLPSLPRRSTDSELDFTFSHQLRTFREDDGSPCQQVPASLPRRSTGSSLGLAISAHPQATTVADNTQSGDPESEEQSGLGTQLQDAAEASNMPRASATKKAQVGTLSLLELVRKEMWDEALERLAMAQPEELNAKTNFCETLLHCAAAQGHSEFCRALLECKQFREVNSKDFDGSTALHVAACNGHAEVCRAILRHEQFMEADALNLWGHTALREAEQYGNGMAATVIRSCRRVISP